MPAPLGRALVLTGSVGSGHTRAAQAVVEAMLRANHAEDAEVVDVLSHAWPMFRAIYRDAYISMIERAPGLVGWLYRSSDTAEGGSARRAARLQVSTWRAKKLLASDARKKGKRKYFLHKIK
jgi:processive 1,2-diacylglycerol beta-glucosyltransferase